MSFWSRIERRLTELADELLPDEFREELVAARSALATGRAAEAAAGLEALVARRPDHVAALALLGAARLELGDFAGARSAFEDALRVREDDAEALLGLGQASLALGQLDTAIDGFRGAVRTSGGDRAVLALAYRGLGMAYRQRGEIDKGVRELRKTLAENPDDLLAHAALGEALLADPRISTEEARHHLDRAVRPDDVAATGRDTADGRGTADGRDAASARVLAALALGRLALADEDGELARHHFQQVLDALAQAAPGEAPGEAPGGRRHDLDQLAYQREALVGLGDANLRLGDATAAHQRYAEALALSPRNAAIHARIGDARRQARSFDEALACYERSLAIAQDRHVLARALETAIEAGAVDTAVRMANDMLALDPRDPRAAVAHGMGMARQGQYEAARATFRAALEAGGGLEAHLALGRLELDVGQSLGQGLGQSVGQSLGQSLGRGDDRERAAGARAAAEALAALRLAPSNERARALLAEARAREVLPLGLAEATPSEIARTGETAETAELRPAAAATGLQRVAAELRRLALTRVELSEIAAEAAQAAADFDQPLLVTVMGEFSSGKSTFVNAFIGHDVAPTGITPTTATINIVKYGREPGGRISYRDGTLEPLAWDELGQALHALDDERVRRIDVVEILFPLPQLERVNIVDTPGLNSILPEHEAVARGFIARADAVIWVFTASQAGKASERRALERIRQEGKRVLGVLNKRDQLSASDVAALVSYVRTELGDLVELVVPVSARKALEQRRGTAGQPDTMTPGAAPGSTPAGAAGAPAGQSDDGSDGNWPVLEAALESRFFAQARELKRDALARRLAGVLARARAVIAPGRAQALDVAAALRSESDALADACTEFIDRVVLAERAALQDATAALYRQAAREVLELVRPRQLPFGSHSATAADRTYLIALLDSGYELALERSRRQVLQALEAHRSRAIQAISAAAGTLGTDAGSDVMRTADDALRLVTAQVFDATRAFLRGYLRGGYVAHFFRSELPKLELVEDAAYDALMRGSPDLDAELALRLATAGTAAISAMSSRLAHWADVADVMAYDVEVGVGRALDELAERWRRWAPAAPAAPASPASPESGPTSADTGANQSPNPAQNQYRATAPADTESDGSAGTRETGDTTDPGDR
jgi:tetratricopeptide (TPR) repeat protein